MKVYCSTFSKGIKLQEKLPKIPDELLKRISDSKINMEEFIKPKESLNSVVSFLSK